MRISFVIANYDGAQKAALYGIQDLLSIANDISRQKSENSPVFEFFEVSYFSETATRESMSWAKQTDTKVSKIVFLPPILKGPVPEKAEPSLIRWILNENANESILCATCGGTFLLAQAGLLDGKKATTHWLLHDVFKERYHKVKLNTDEMVIEDGRIYTSGGIMAWVDLGLALIERFQGMEVRRKAARYFVVESATKPQNAFQAFTPNIVHCDESILKVQKCISESPQLKYSMKALSKMAKLEPRTFSRRFKKATGFTPSEFQSRAKIERARQLLETSNQNIEQIAFDLGFSDARNLRRNFKKNHGISPADYRKRFK